MLFPCYVVFSFRSCWTSQTIVNTSCSSCFWSGSLFAFPVFFPCTWIFSVKHLDMGDLLIELFSHIYVDFIVLFLLMTSISMISELLSKEWKDLFWEFIEVWLHSEGNDANSSTARDCLKKIIGHGNSLIGHSLASLFEFSLLLRSASPRLVLYRQLAEESLSSFPLTDDISSSNANTGRCCWVDTGGELFFDIAELKLWLHGPERCVPFSFPRHCCVAIIKSLWLCGLLIKLFSTFWQQLWRCFSSARTLWLWSRLFGLKYSKSNCYPIWSSWK